MERTAPVHTRSRTRSDHECQFNRAGLNRISLLWGTQGLVRYDGVDFKHFVNIYDDTTSINAGEVYKSQVGTDGFIWLTLRFNGLNRFDPRTNSFKRYSLPALPEKLNLVATPSWKMKGGIFGQEDNDCDYIVLIANKTLWKSFIRNGSILQIREDALEL